MQFGTVGIVRVPTNAMLYLGTTQGVFRLNPDTGVVARFGPLDTSVESLAVAGDTIVVAVTPDYGLPIRRPLNPTSHAGAVRSTDTGRTWSPIPDLASHQITALAASSRPLSVSERGRGDEVSPPLVFAGTDPAEILVSRDGGATWTQGQSLREMPGYDEWAYPLPPHTPHVMLFAPHPSRPETVYGGVEVGGIVRSDDGGQHWRVIGAQPGAAVHPDIHGLAICPAAPEVIYCATPQGVYVSDDGGKTWQQRIDGLDPLYCRPIAVHQQDPDVAVVVATNGASGFFGIPAERTGGGIFRTEDRGRSWHHVVDGLPDPLAPAPSIAADAATPGRFYLPLFSGDVFVIDDAGHTWHELARGLPPILRIVST